MRHTNYLWMGLFGVSMQLGGCQSDTTGLSDELQVQAPVSTDRNLVYEDRTHDELVFVSAIEDALNVRREVIGTEDDVIAWKRPTVDRDALLLMNVAVDAKQEDVVEQLIRIDSNTLDRTVYDVGAPFTDVALSSDGRYAVLYFGQASNSQPLQNVNQAAIVDFTADAVEEAVRLITLDGFGGRVEGVVFPDDAMGINVAGIQRDLAVFVAVGEVVIVDLADERADETQVAFRFDTSVNFRPSRILARPADDLIDSPALFFVSPNDADVTMLSLLEKPQLGDIDTTDRFTVQPGLLPVGLSSNAIALYNSNDVPYLLAFRSTGILFTNIETQADFFVDFGAKIEDGFLRPSTQSGVPSTEVVAWALGGSYLFTLDLTNIESALGRTPTLHKIADRVRAVSVVNDAKVLVTSVEDSFEFYLVDFDKQLVAPLRSSVPFDLDRVFVDAGRVIIGAPDYDVVSSIDLDTLDTESVVLDAPLQRLHRLRATGRAMAVHADSAGFFTDLDARDLSRAGARSFWGFILDGALDRAGEGN